MRIVAKPVKPSISPVDAFLQQRQADGQSVQLREAVKAMLRPGKARTTTVAKVFALLVETDPDRFGASDIKAVLRGFEVEND